MAQERLSVRKIKEVLRLKWACGLPNRAVARSCHVAPSTVSEYIRRANWAGLSWPLPDELDDTALQSRLFPPTERPAEERIPMPDWSAVHAELARKGVTRQLVWQEYLAENAGGYGYSQFCKHYQSWRRQLHPTMRQTHEAGEAMVDYAGLTMAVVDPETGETRGAEIFVHILAASSYIYAEGHWSQDLASWIGGHERAHQDLGGVPPVTVVDNLKSGVTHPCRYDPDVNPTYHSFSVHCGTAVVPTRVAKPRDKAKAESAVQVVERDVLAPLRKMHFIGLATLNAAIAERLHVVNHRTMRHIGQSRVALLESIDRPALLPLPFRKFELANWKRAKVPIDYHVEYDHHFYSVPYQLIGQHVEIRATADTVEVLTGGTRAASHRRSRMRGAHTTDPAHMTEGHRAHVEWTPELIVAQADRIGPETAAVVAVLMDGRAHPRQAVRACLGVVRLAERHTPERLEDACRYARAVDAIRYKSIKHILAAGLVLQADQVMSSEPLPAHANVRGAAYFK